MPTLKQWQREGVDWLKVPTLRSGEGHKLLADEPACGKTVQVAVALAELKSTSLIICPKNVKDANGWRERLIEWGAYTNEQIQIINTSKDIVDISKRCIVVNYELAVRPRIRTQLQLTQVGTMVVDEGHRAKSVMSSVSQKLLSRRHGKPLAACANRVWVVTGTPAPNGNALELFPWLLALAPECLGRYTTQQLFGDRYCAGEAANYKGSTNRDELNAALQRFMLARKLHEVEPDTPTVNWENIYLDLGVMQEDETNTDRSTLRRLLADVAAPFVAEFINELILKNQERVVCFAYHRSVVDLLVERCNGRPFYGGQTEQQRSAILEWFKNEGLLLVVQYTAGGTALDGLQFLTNTVVMCEPDWVPDLQAIRRIERIGQTEHINAYRFFGQGTQQEVMVRRQKTKGKQAKELTNMARKPITDPTGAGDMLVGFLNDISRIADALEAISGKTPDATPIKAEAKGDAKPAESNKAADTRSEVQTTKQKLTVEEVRDAAKAALARFPDRPSGEAAVNKFYLGAFGKNKTSELDPKDWEKALAGLSTLGPVASNDDI